MDWIFAGIPVHSLLVHFTVVIIPAAALAVVVTGLWPAARRRLGIFTPVLALLALIAVPLTVQAGQWLVVRVEPTQLIKAHEAIGTSLLPWVIALFVVSVLQWLWYRFREHAEHPVRIRVVTMVILVVAIAVSAGSVVTVVRVGEAGSTAAWDQRFSDEPLEAP